MTNRKSTSKFLVASLCVVSLTAAVIVFKTQNPNLSRLSISPPGDSKNPVDGFSSKPFSHFGSKLKQQRHISTMQYDDNDWQSERWNVPEVKYKAIQDDIDKALQDVQKNGYPAPASAEQCKKTLAHYKAILDKSPNDPLAVFSWGYVNWKCASDFNLPSIAYVGKAEINKKLFSIKSPKTAQFAMLKLLTAPVNVNQRKIAQRLEGHFPGDKVLTARLGRILLWSDSPTDKTKASQIDPIANYTGPEIRYDEVMLLHKDVLLSNFTANPSSYTAHNLSQYLEACNYIIHDPALKKENQDLILKTNQSAISMANSLAKTADETTLLHNSVYLYDMSGDMPNSYNDYYTWMTSSKILCGQLIVNTVSQNKSTAGVGFNHILSISHDGKWILSMDSNTPNSNKFTSISLHITSSKNWKKTDLHLYPDARTSPKWCPDNRHFAFISDAYNDRVLNYEAQLHRPTKIDYSPEASNTQQIINTNKQHLIIYDADNKRMETIELPLLISNNQLEKLRNDAKKFNHHMIWASSEGDLLSITPQNKFIFGRTDIDLNAKWNYEREVAQLKDPQSFRNQIALQKDQKLAQRQLEILNDPKLLQRRLEAYKATINTDFNLYEVTLKGSKPSVRSWSVEIPQVLDADRINVEISPDSKYILWRVNVMPSRSFERSQSGSNKAVNLHDIKLKDRPHTELIVTDIYGKNPRDLGSTEMDSSIHWNPDSRHIGFMERQILWQKSIN